MKKAKTKPTKVYRKYNNILVDTITLDKFVNLLTFSRKRTEEENNKIIKDLKAGKEYRTKNNVAYTIKRTAAGN